MKQILLCLIFLFNVLLSKAQSDFITRWDLSKPGTSNTELTFDTETSGVVSYTWATLPAGTVGTGTFTGTVASITGLPADAIVQLSINPINLKRFYFYSGVNPEKLIDVEQWGTAQWTSMEYAFSGCYNLQISATDLPDFTLVNSMYWMFGNCQILNSPSNIDTWNTANVTNMAYLFVGALAFNQPINSWNTSNVQTMYRMFSSASVFNQPIGSWNTGNVSNMSWMFKTATSFNQPLDSWNTSNVTNMEGMFSSASAFNQPIGSWNIINVTTMKEMFNFATSFNQSIDSWNISSVTTMSEMFRSATSFNQPLNSWNTSTVYYMRSMFENAIAFNQPLSSWNIVQVNDMTNMFKGASNFNQPIGSWNVINVYSMGDMFKNATNFNQSLATWSTKLESGVFMYGMLDNCGMNVANYDATLIAFNSNAPNGRNLGAANLKYCDADLARTNLINNKNWTITGDAKVTNASATFASGVLTCSTIGATYQWIDCNNGNAEISGETNQNFSPTVDGSYAVIVNSNACVDTSDCTSVIVTNIKSLGDKNSVTVFPNPANEKITLTNAQGLGVIILTNLLGEEILKKETIDKAITIDLKELGNGIYLIKTRDKTLKLIKN